MGMFLSLSGVIGKTHTEVVRSLTNYVKSVNGIIQQENLTADNDSCCVIEEANNNTTILYPYDYLEWDKSSEFISKELKSPIFSCHIHDGDFWMYILYVDGEIVDQFNPIPEYWNENLSKEEIESWKGNPATIVKYVSGINLNDIEKYLVRWSFENEGTVKAYPDDKFTNEDWQLLDFLKKLRIPYPLDDNENPKGQTYRLQIKELPFKPLAEGIPSTAKILPKTKAKKKFHYRPWWKFW